MQAGARAGELRVGSVPYLVGRPLDLGLEQQPGIRYERRVPAELVAGLRAVELDVALVSSIELFRGAGYRYLDGLGVCGAGFVGSVQVFLRRPIAEVRSLALDPASRAAAALVRVLLDGQELRFVDVPSGADPREAGTDAWLRIGDAALREHHAEPELPVFNPAQEWSRRSGLPFVFALWIVRPGVELGARAQAFAEARARGRSALPQLARAASVEWDLPLATCEHYLARECLYEPGASLRPALLAFQTAAARLGLCQAGLEPAALSLAHVP